MKNASDRKDIVEARELLEILPDIYFAVLKNTFIEQETEFLVRCTFDLPLIGKRVKTAPSAIDAMKEALSEISELLICSPKANLNEAWHNLLATKMEIPVTLSHLPTEIKNNRFQAKARQLTIGVTIPMTLKSSLQEIAQIQKLPFSEVVREFTSLGFEEFDKRTFSENSRKLLDEFLLDIKKWGSSDTEQIMLRVDPYLGIRLRTTAKEFKRSASEFGSMCMAHGLSRQLQLESIEKKVLATRGSNLRNLAPKIGLSTNVALLSGVLAGSIAAPKQLIKRLSEYFEATEISLITFLKLSCDARPVPAFKAEHGKPQVYRYATPWEEAVRKLGLQETQIKELLELDN